MRVRSRLALALAWRPEWPVVLLAALAWLTLLSEAAWPALTIAGGAGHAGHAAHTAHLADRDSAGTAGALMHWALMSLAMMLPVTLPAVRHLAVNSLRVRRNRALGLFVATFVGVWIMFGIAALALRNMLQPADGDGRRYVLAAVLLVAAAWQMTPIKRRALFACRRTVALPPLGRPADRAAVRYGLQQARRCVLACWGLMSVMAITYDHVLLWMTALTVLVIAEELPLVGWRLLRASAVSLAVTSALVVSGL